MSVSSVFRNFGLGQTGWKLLVRKRNDPNFRFRNGQPDGPLEMPRHRHAHVGRHPSMDAWPRPLQVAERSGHGEALTRQKAHVTLNAALPAICLHSDWEHPELHEK